MVNNTYVAVQCFPNKEVQQNMALEEKERLEKQRQELGQDGLAEKATLLQKAIEFNDREPPKEMLTSIPIPSLKSIQFHHIVRYSTESNPDGRLDLSKTPIFTYFDHLKTGFVFVCTYYVEYIWNNMFILSFSALCFTRHLKGTSEIKNIFTTSSRMSFRIAN